MLLLVRMCLRVPTWVRRGLATDLLTSKQRALRDFVSTVRCILLVCVSGKESIGT